MYNPLAQFIRPNVRQYLIVDEGEFVIDEVAKHWVTLIKPSLALLLCIPIFLLMPTWHQAFFLPLIGGLALMGWALFRIHREHMDRFVITNMRVFRVSGVFNQKLATMPIARILDISVQQPFFGQILNYGNFTFETAAQDQGLREIKYIGKPKERDLTIQTIVQRAGLRAKAKWGDDDT